MNFVDYTFFCESKSEQSHKYKKKCDLRERNHTEAYDDSEELFENSKKKQNNLNGFSKRV